MTDKQQPEPLRLAALLEKTGAQGSLRDEAASELRRLHAELETMRAKLKTHEDLGDAGSDVQLLRMGYAAARLEIESLKAQLAAQQPGAAYAALPDEGEPWRGHKFKEVQRGCWRCDCGKTIKEAASDQSTPASGGNYPVMPKRYTIDDDGEELFTAEKMRAFADATHALRASHGQAPALPVGPCVICGSDEPFTRTCGSRDPRALCRQPTPTAQAAPASVLHLVHSAFAEIAMAFPKAFALHKVGIADTAVRETLAASAAVAGPSGYGPKVTVKRRCSDCKACNSESYAVQGDSGHYVYCEHPSLPERKYIGDTHWDTPDWCPASAPTTQPAPQQEAQEPVAVVVPCHTPSGKRVALYSAKQDLPIGTQLYTAPQPSPAAQGDALDTMRLDWLDADESRCVFHLGKSWYTRPSYGLPYRKRASLREAIDAARKEMP